MKNSKLHVETPCEKRWNDLEGNGGKRHCEACALHVIDGSALTKEAAEAVVTEARSTGDRVCMRMLVDKSGQFVHRESAPEHKGLSAWKAGAVFAAGALVSCGEGAETPNDPGPAATEEGIETPSTEPPSERPPEILGAICYVEEPVEEPPGPDEAESGHGPSDLREGAESPQHTPEELLEMMGGMRLTPLPSAEPEDSTPE